MSESALHFICARTWLESLLKLVLFHFSAKTNLSSTDRRASFIFTGPWEQASLANTKIRAYASTNNMSTVLIVDGWLVGFIFTWTWHIEILIALSSNLDTHMELRLSFNFLKVSSNFVSSGCWCQEVGTFNLFTFSITYFDSMVDMSRIVRMISLRSNWL